MSDEHDAEEEMRLTARIFLEAKRRRDPNYRDLITSVAKRTGGGGVKVDVTGPATLLRQIAGACPPPPKLKRGEELKRLCIETTCGPAKFTLRVEPDPDKLRARADLLERQERSARRSLTTGVPLTVPKVGKQAKRSDRIAQQFLDDNEPENYKNYCELYD